MFSLLTGHWIRVDTFYRHVCCITSIVYIDSTIDVIPSCLFDFVRFRRNENCASSRYLRKWIIGSVLSFINNLTISRCRFRKQNNNNFEEKVI